MKDFLGKLTQKANEVGDQLSKKTEELGKKTEEVVEIQKLKSQVRGLERENVLSQTRIGEVIYGMYENGELLNTEVTEICKEVEARNEDIKGLEAQVNILKGHKACGSCGEDVDYSTPFCEQCGEKLEETTKVNEEEENIFVEEVEVKTETSEETEVSAE